MLGEVPCPPSGGPRGTCTSCHSLFTLPRPAPIPPCTKQSPDPRLSHRCSSPGGSPLAPPGFPRPSSEISAKQAHPQEAAAPATRCAIALVLWGFLALTST